MNAGPFCMYLRVLGLLQGRFLKILTLNRPYCFFSDKSFEQSNCFLVVLGMIQVIFVTLNTRIKANSDKNSLPGLTLVLFCYRQTNICVTK